MSPGEAKMGMQSDHFKEGREKVGDCDVDVEYGVGVKKSEQ